MSRRIPIPDGLCSVETLSKLKGQSVRKTYQDLRRNPHLLPPTLLHRGKRFFVVGKPGDEIADPNRWEREAIERAMKAAEREHREVVTAAASDSTS